MKVGVRDEWLQVGVELGCMRGAKYWWFDVVGVKDAMFYCCFGMWGWL